MKYRVKVKGGVSVFHDKELAEKCAQKNNTKVEAIVKDPNLNKPFVPFTVEDAIDRQKKGDK